MLDLPILPAGALPAPTPGPSNPKPASPEGASFADALGTAAAKSEPAEPTTVTPALDEATLAALAALAGAGVTVPVPVVPAAPQQPLADLQPSEPSPDVTVLVPVTKPGPRLELANPHPLAPTPQAGAQPELEAPQAPDAQPVKGALPGRGQRFGDVWVNATPALTAPEAPATPPSMVPTAAATPTPTVESAQPLAAAQAEAPAPTKASARSAPIEAAAAPPTPQAPGVAALQAVHVAKPEVEPARLAEVQPKEVIAQIQHAVEQLGEQKLETVRITLHPAELGRIELRVTHGADQGLQVSVRAEQPHTVALLEQHLTELQSNLSASGLDVANVAISAGLGSQHQQSNRSFHGARPFGINLRGIKGGETDPYDSDRPIVMRLNSARGWSNAGVDLSI
ncbi:MAG: flagellar hook-length control protein FliK [Anaerolineales bacterium]|nr:flagellar hook-length control protein FliK [Anaerolineales bacterium]